jgi:hypothetical protein
LQEQQSASDDEGDDSEGASADVMHMLTEDGSTAQSVAAEAVASAGGAGEAFVDNKDKTMDMVPNDRRLSEMATI